MQYFLSARSETEVSGYFYVLPDSGDVILAKPLSEITKTTFTVRYTFTSFFILVIDYFSLIMYPNPVSNIFKAFHTGKLPD